MKPLKPIVLPAMILLLVFSIMLSPVSSLFIIVTLRTDKTAYHYRELVTVYGNVTNNGNLVTDGLVAIQILDPVNVTKLLRTVPANTTPTETWPVEILSFEPVDAGGDPKTIFNRNGWAYFRTRFRSNEIFINREVLLAITLCDSDETYIHFYWMTTIINPGATHEDLVGLWIDDWVSFGQAMAYASLHSDWPSQGGYPYSPGKNTSFSIVNTDNSPEPPPSVGTASYKMSFRLPPDAKLGTFTVRVSTYSGGDKDTNNRGVFYRQYELLGDIVFDGKIDIFDVVKVSTAYGSQGGEPNWEPEADLDPDGEISIFDVVIVTTNYGTSY
jgi:hypothetical protein